MKNTKIYTSENLYKAICNKTQKSILIRAKNEKIAFEIAEDFFNHLDINLILL
jgi:hypothetical protein